MSGIYLLIAVAKIKRFAQETGNASLLNTKVIALHVITFWLYLISTMTSITLQITEYFVSYSYAFVLWADIICGLLSFISQVFICYILATLGRRIHDYKPVEVKDFDEYQELQAALWNQFYRKQDLTDILETVDSDDLTSSMFVT